jgi:hypothetical protein
MKIVEPVPRTFVLLLIVDLEKDDVPEPTMAVLCCVWHGLCDVKAEASAVLQFA